MCSSDLPGESLGPMFSQVVGTIFEIMRHKVEFWREVKWSKPTAIFGFGLGEMEMPPAVNVDLERLYDKFQAGFEEYDAFLKEILSADMENKLSEIKRMDLSNFEFPAHLWAMILAEFAVAYKDGIYERERIMESLIPLYFGRTCSSVIQLEPMNIQQAEEVIEEQCIVFERSKPYLLKKWFDEK